MKVKISELEKTALDWAVATRGGLEVKIEDWGTPGMRPTLRFTDTDSNVPRYSAGAKEGAALTHAHRISVLYAHGSTDRRWAASREVLLTNDPGQFAMSVSAAHWSFGQTPSIAAMRCLARILHNADEIDVPRELLGVIKEQRN